MIRRSSEARSCQIQLKLAKSFLRSPLLKTKWSHFKHVQFFSQTSNVRNTCTHFEGPLIGHLVGKTSSNTSLFRAKQNS